MASRRIGLASAALTLALAGCGGSATSPASLGQLPLVDGAKVITQTRLCDRGENAFCALQAVIVDPQFRSSGALVAAEHRYLRKRGWSSMAGDNGDERAAESPGHKLRLTYATGASDLQGIELRWIKRPRSIMVALDQQLFNGTPTMSVMLETGAT